METRIVNTEDIGATRTLAACETNRRIWGNLPRPGRLTRQRCWSC